MSRVETMGRAPTVNGPYMVEFRSGLVSGPFTREQIRWSDTGCQWDAVAVTPAGDRGTHETWNAKSGGY